MGFIGGIILTVMLGVGIYSWAVDPGYRKKLAREYSEDPLGFLFAMFGVVAFVAFIWGLVFAAFGANPIVYIGRTRFEAWQLAGLSSLAWLVIGIIGYQMRYPRR